MFGVFAALRTWERKSQAPLARSLLSRDGHLLLPIALDEQDLGSGFWIDGDGTILFDEDLEETYVFASSFSVFLERVAFIRERLSRWRSPWFAECDGTLVIHGCVGSTVATALDLPLFGPASDGFSSTWFVPNRALVVEEAAYFGATTVTASTLDSVLMAAQAVVGHVASGEVSALQRHDDWDTGDTRGHGMLHGSRSCTTPGSGSRPRGPDERAPSLADLWGWRRRYRYLCMRPAQRLLVPRQYGARIHWPESLK